MLRLTVAPAAAGVIAEARLTNEGHEPWTYEAGGGLPPPIQIEARDAEGQRVYCWIPPAITAHWRAQRTLPPGEGLEARAEINASGPLSIHAFVTGHEDLVTDNIEVAATPAEIPESRDDAR